MPDIVNNEDRNSFDMDTWMPFDTLILSIFGGRISPDCVGPVMPSLDVIQDKFNLLKHTEPIQSPDGEWSITTWSRKSRSEL